MQLKLDPHLFHNVCLKYVRRICFGKAKLSSLVVMALGVPARWGFVVLLTSEVTESQNILRIVESSS